MIMRDRLNFVFCGITIQLDILCLKIKQGNNRKFDKIGLLNSIGTGFIAISYTKYDLCSYSLWKT